MAQTHEWMFYEVMWRNQSRGRILPLPWWTQQYFRHWVEPFDSGLFSSREAAFASNALYRYWNMVGVKDHHQESLVGQAGEIEPVYDSYTLAFSLFDPARREMHFPQLLRPQVPGVSLRQELENGYLPVVRTTWQTGLGIELEQKVLATTLGIRQRSIVVARFRARLSSAPSAQAWLCLAMVPAGPTGFERHDKAGRISDRRVTFLRYLPAEQRVEAGTSWGPLFDAAPVHFGLYGNQNSDFDPDRYLIDNPYHDLATQGALNGRDSATDHVAGLCSGVFAWPFQLNTAQPEFTLDVKLPVDDYRGASDVVELRSADPDVLEINNRNYWLNKLDATGLQATLPPEVHHLFDLYRTCRANLLILADDGQIHPGPTIYDSFWIRDSSIEAVACALAGDPELAERQLGTHHKAAFNFGFDRIGPVSLHGFFGREHEKNDREWDSNGQALWAFGRFDRISGGAAAFGAGLFSPYVLDGARWIRDNRSQFGLLHSGWSAEHIGEADKPHYWDDFWALAGLYEAARLAERIHAPEAAEIWNIFDDLKWATVNSIRWLLGEQRRRGQWQTFIPTGPADVGRLDSTMVGTLAYFHPCRLYLGPKLEADIDLAARLTLDTIWARFIDGGFRHDSAWSCYGPYLTLQLAHCFLLVGDVARMDQCLKWSVHNAAYAQVSRNLGSNAMWQVVLGAWNEQHCYPIAKNFAEVPAHAWYMGDIPHGWACAEFMTLLREILFFEADEDGDAQIYLAPGVMPHWLGDGQTVGVANAPTAFGTPFGFRLTHRPMLQRIEIEITTPPPAHVRFIYTCPFGSAVRAILADGIALSVSGRTALLPAGTRAAVITYF